MSLLKSGFSAIGKLLIVAALAVTFLFGMGSVVYMSLQGDEIKVPEITGKDFVESEKELTALGLKIKKRADRYSTEKQNTILEQLPKAGDTVKTGQMILVVTSKTNPEGEEAPATIKKNLEEDDSEKIEELISDKPKKSGKTNQNQNSNKKKSSTTRDVIKDKTNANSDAANSENSNSNAGNSNSSSNKSNKNSSTNSNGKPSNTSNSNKPAANKAPASGGDVRPRKTPKP